MLYRRFQNYTVFSLFFLLLLGKETKRKKYILCLFFYTWCALFNFFPPFVADNKCSIFQRGLKCLSETSFKNHWIKRSAEYQGQNKLLNDF